MARLLVKDLAIFRSEKSLIKPFSHHFNAGRIYALIGNNGSGKTTLLKTMAGLLNHNEGNILIENRSLKTMSLKNRASLISFLLQHSPEQPYCTAKSRIAHGLMPTLGYNYFLTKHIETEILIVARKLQIEHLLNRMLAKLSGGEQRLVHIAKCLINQNTKILLLDEPTAFLDFTQQTNLLNNLLDQAQRDRLIIFSSHDREFIKRCANYIIAINNQQIDIFNNN